MENLKDDHDPLKIQDLEIKDELEDMTLFMKLDMQIEQQEAVWKSIYRMP